MNAWSHLPNAAAIDEVLESLKKHPEAWDAAWDTTRDAAGCAAWDAARDAAWGAAWGAARDTTRDTTRDAAWSAAWDAARSAAWSAVAALIAYDDAGKLIKQPVAHLQGLYRLDPHPAFLLFQPASLVFNQLEFKT